MAWRAIFFTNFVVDLIYKNGVIFWSVGDYSRKISKVKNFAFEICIVFRVTNVILKRSFVTMFSSYKKLFLHCKWVALFGGDSIFR